MAIINELNLGEYAPYNGMTMYRRYNSDQGFQTIFKVHEEDGVQRLDMGNVIIVPYIEYFKNSEGNIVDGLTIQKNYLVVNYPAIDELPASEMANNWFLSLARTPITAEYGIMDSIEHTLSSLPQDIPNGFQLPRQ